MYEILKTLLLIAVIGISIFGIIFPDKYVKTENVGNKAAYTKTRISCAILMVFGIITLVINFLF